MSTASEEILAKYRVIEREADDLGRVIGVHRLRPSQAMRLSEWANFHDDATKATFNLAACVCEIDGVPIPFPRNRAELDAIIDRLDEPGIKATGVACARLYGFINADGEELTLVDEAKKSSGTPTSPEPSGS